MVNPTHKDRGILTDEETDAMIDNADLILNPYFQLRAKAIIAFGKIFGKRRGEIAQVLLNDLKIGTEYLLVIFTLEKKQKKGLFQYLKLLEKNNPTALNKPLSELQVEWREWQKTKEGHKIKQVKAPHEVALTDKYTHYILDYHTYLTENYGGPELKYVFPSGRMVYGETYQVLGENHLSGSQILRIIKPLDETAWMHLFRDTKGAQIAQEKGRTIDAVYEVKDTLDLEREETAWHYIHRYAAKRQTGTVRAKS
jgi:integrase